jgi:hypothetical protein
MGGVFQVDREIFHHDIWEDVVKFRIFFYILGQAIFLEEGVTVAGIKLERGQYLRSLRKLQEDLAYKEGRGGAIKTYPLTTLQNKIKTLVKDEQITIKSTESGTLFTVVNYALYQGFERFKKGEVEQLSNSNRTAIEQSPNNNKKVNKANKEKKEHYADEVTMLTSEFQTLVDSHGEQAVKEMISILDNYKGASGKKYKSDYRAILNWVVKRYEEDLTKNGGKVTSQTTVNKQPKLFDEKDFLRSE